MKRIVICILVFAMAALAACNTDTPKEVTMNAAEIYAEVYAVSGYGTMTAVPDRDLTDIYAIDPDKVADRAWYMSDNPSLNADEVAIFKAVDEEYAAELVTIFNQRIEDQKLVAMSYSPAEFSKLDNAQVVQSGCWVYYAVGTEYAAMMDVLGTIFVE